MTPFWHPLSALILPDLGTWATPAMLRMLLRAGPLELVYAGDRMRPAVRHGQRVEVRALDGRAPRPGEVLVACVDGVPDLLRVVDGGPSGQTRLCGDADPARPVVVAPADRVARAELGRRGSGSWARAWRRCVADHAEALRGAAPDGEATESVRSKYDLQAPFYAAGPDVAMDPDLVQRVRAALPASGRLLVAGCGAGRECFALAAGGRAVTGVDFSAAMIDQARAAARRRGADVEFARVDLREHERPAGSLAGIFFTYDLYSFLPDESERIALLRRMAGWLAPGGAILLSARRVHGPYQRWILTLQWARRGFRRWGASHTRYLGTDGSLRRSFVHYFVQSRLRREVRRAGLTLEAWRGGHAVARPRPS